ncbi:hypothetical protein BHM03_00047207 [Ensete ventricosum]|nr:hypothetical protein BHM03_00047207 [Ensete ventricosum]
MKKKNYHWIAKSSMKVSDYEIRTRRSRRSDRKRSRAYRSQSPGQGHAENIDVMAEDGPRRGAKSRAGPRRPEGAAAIMQAMRQRKETMHLDEEDAKADDCQRKPERERGIW